MDIIKNTKFNNNTKMIEIFSLYGNNDMLIGAIIHDNVLRDAVLTAIRNAEIIAFKSGAQESN